MVLACYGGVSGSKQEQTQRAKNFESPKEERIQSIKCIRFDNKKFSFLACYLVLSSRLFTFLSDTGSDFAEPVTTPQPQEDSNLFWVAWQKMVTF